MHINELFSKIHGYYTQASIDKLINATLMLKNSIVDYKDYVKFSPNICKGMLNYLNGECNLKQCSLKNGINLADINNAQNHNLGACGPVIECLSALLQDLQSDYIYEDKEHFKTNILPQLQKIEDWLLALYWGKDGIVYKDGNQDFKAWCNEPENKIWPCIAHLTAFISSLYDLAALDKLKSFFLDFANSNRADINIVSIGCNGIKEQQVYPWVYKVARKYPSLKFQIDVFDKFESLPDVIKDDAKQDLPSWERLDPCTYRYLPCDNILLKVNACYFPCAWGGSQIVHQIYPLLLNCVQDLLSNNKVVIFSEHTGGSENDSYFMRLFNELNANSYVNVANLFLIAQCLSAAVIYNNELVDSIEMYLPVDNWGMFVLDEKSLQEEALALRSLNKEKIVFLFDTFKQFFEQSINFNDSFEHMELSPCMFALIDKFPVLKRFVTAYCNAVYKEICFYNQKPNDLNLRLEQRLVSFAPRIMALYKEYRARDAANNEGLELIDAYLVRLDAKLGIIPSADSSYLVPKYPRVSMADLDLDISEMLNNRSLKCSNKFM
jgi:hypothetical protein